MLRSRIAEAERRRINPLGAGYASPLQSGDQEREDLLGAAWQASEIGATAVRERLPLWTSGSPLRV
jgi:hypothetical protein